MRSPVCLVPYVGFRDADGVMFPLYDAQARLAYQGSGSQVCGSSPLSIAQAPAVPMSSPAPQVSWAFLRNLLAMDSIPAIELCTHLSPVVDVRELLRQTFVDPSYDAAGVAPHALTTRWDVQIPNGVYNAVLKRAHIIIYRDAAPTNAGQVQATINIVRAGAVLIALRTQFFNASIGASDRNQLSYPVTLRPGDHIIANTADLSNGVALGSVQYNINASIEW